MKPIKSELGLDILMFLNACDPNGFATMFAAALRTDKMLQFWVTCPFK